ncbi:MAG: hypothetical protein IPJ85_17935 [Flavobacteriales bacterium]|nr:hypothetical protein [Flavobacteriales bacterium]
MSIAKSALLLSATALISCSSTPGSTAANDAEAHEEGGDDRQPRFTEGKDYIRLERVRFMDNTGFQRPAEAFSVLLP